MNFLHYDVNASKGDIVRVTLDKQANVRLMDDSNFAAYKRGQQHHYYGGLATKSPIDITVPQRLLDEIKNRPLPQGQPHSEAMQATPGSKELPA